MKRQKIILYILSLLFIFGGVVRLFAHEGLFEFFKMGGLWVDDPYFIYVYRVLGAFVIFIGLILFWVAKNIAKNPVPLWVMLWGFLLLGLTMALSGYLVNLPFYYYAPDFLFCIAVSINMYSMYRLEKVLNEAK